MHSKICKFDLCGFDKELDVSERVRHRVNSIEFLGQLQSSVSMTSPSLNSLFVRMLGVILYHMTSGGWSNRIGCAKLGNCRG